MGVFSTTLVLEHLNGPSAKKKVKVIKDTFMLGSDQECDHHHFTEEEKVSRKHALIEQDPVSGSWWIKDEGSSRGTWLSIGSKEYQSAPFPLFPGVMFKVGKTNFNVVLEEKKECVPNEIAEEVAKTEKDSSSKSCQSTVASTSFAANTMRISEAVFAGAKMNLAIRFRPGNGKGYIKVPLNREYTIGSSKECSIVLHQEEGGHTAFCHAKVTSKDGIYVIEDQGTEWGTYVKLASSGPPCELNWGDVVLLGYSKMLVQKGTNFTLFKRMDDCCMQAALRCFGVDNISMQNSIGESLGTSSVFNRWMKHQEARNGQGGSSDIKDYATSVITTEYQKRPQVSSEGVGKAKGNKTK